MNDVITVVSVGGASACLEALQWWSHELSGHPHVQHADLFDVVRDAGSPFADRGWLDGVHLLVAWNVDAIAPPVAERAAVAVRELVAVGGDWVGVAWPVSPNGLATACETAMREVGGTWLDPVSEARAMMDGFGEPRADESAIAMAAAAALLREWYTKSGFAHKVVVVDCDDTLWSGDCAELGPDGVTIESHNRTLQQWLLRQREAGVLLALCSKNIEADVWSVFERQREMQLAPSDFDAFRISWNPKSVSVRDLARELGLSWDSFVFIDNDEHERDEVASECPGIAILALPASTEEWPDYLSRLWCLDRRPLTDEDRARSRRYREERVRRIAVNDSSSDALAVLRSLEVHLESMPLTPDLVPRAAQLLTRANQFRLTASNVSADRLRELCRRSTDWARVLSASDRFGEYGVIGVCLGAPRSGALKVDQLILSCRVLRKGLEARVAEWLATEAAAAGCARVVLSFESTGRNHAAASFVRVLQDACSAVSGDGFVTVDAGRLRGLSPEDFLADLSARAAADADGPERVAFGDSERESGIARWVAACTRHYVRLTAQRFSAATADAAIDAAATDGPTPSILEQFVASEFARALGVPRVGLDDDFFRLGGDSLMAVRMLGGVREVIPCDESVIAAFFDQPTPRAVAVTLEQGGVEHSTHAAMEARLSLPADLTASSELNR